MIRCAISGATGLVGDAVRRHLESRGYATVSLTRRAGSFGDSIPFELRKPIPPEWLRGVEVLIHCAYDWSARTWFEIQATNVRGSIDLVESAIAAGVRTVIFVSSLSAYPGCRSLYGRGKELVEEFVRGRGGIVIRPGLVYGTADKGMFGALARVATWPILPVFDGGRQPLYLVHAADLAIVFERVIVAAPRAVQQPVVAAAPNPVPFRQLLIDLARARGRHPVLISVPGRLALAAMRSAEAIGIPVGFRSDSLLGLLHPNPSLDFSGLAALGVRLRPFSEQTLGSALQL